jgi:sterol desaturase/sphingolipid hydroxylase (fatty acid hydroxylase superfamily)
MPIDRGGETMTVREFLTNIAILSTIMAIAALIESAVPMFTRASASSDRRAANAGLTAIVFLLNWFLSSTVAMVSLAASVHPLTVISHVGLPAAVQIAGGIVLLDFSVGYLSHRTLHMIPFLWRFHRVHHSDEFVDITTTYRTHPIETVWRFLFVVVPVWTLGIPAQAVVIQRLIAMTNGILEHANIRLWAPLDRVCSLVWVTPNVHKIHHSRNRDETNTNYGNVLSIYDRVLGTFTPAHRAATVVYGLDDGADLAEASQPGLVALPFQGEERRASTVAS